MRKHERRRNARTIAKGNKRGRKGNDTIVSPPLPCVIRPLARALIPRTAGIVVPSLNAPIRTPPPLPPSANNLTSRARISNLVHSAQAGASLLARALGRV